MNFRQNLILLLERLFLEKNPNDGNKSDDIKNFAENFEVSGERGWEK